MGGVRGRSEEVSLGAAAGPMREEVQGWLELVSAGAGTGE